MTKQDWRNDDDYAYTKKLDNQGWAWEFIRRQADYRREFEECRRNVEENFDGDWDKEEPEFHPRKGSSETFEEWSKRLRSGKHSWPDEQILTDRQKRARHWALCDMYDPETVFDPDAIKFDTAYPYPAICPNFDDRVTDRSRNIVDARQFNELFETRHRHILEDLVFIAFDTRKPISHQIDKVRDFLNQYQKGSSVDNSHKKPQQANFEVYLRMLDAMDCSEEKLTPGKAIKQIDRYKKFKGAGGYDKVDYKTINKFGEDVLRSAIDVRDRGFATLIFKIQYVE